jgi:integrase
VLDDRIVVTLGKTGKRLAIKRTLPLDLTMADLPKNSPLLFASSSGKTYSSSGFASIWQRAMRKYVQSTSHANRFTEHDLRGKVATEIGDAATAQRLLGHKSITMTEKYIKARQTDVVMPHTRKPNREDSK